VTKDNAHSPPPNWPRRDAAVCQWAPRPNRQSMVRGRRCCRVKAQGCVLTALCNRWSEAYPPPWDRKETAQRRCFDSEPKRPQDLIPNRDASDGVGISRRSDHHFRWSDVDLWAWLDLNQRPHPQVKMPPAVANCQVLTKVDADLALSAEQSTAQGPCRAANLHPSGWPPAMSHLPSMVGPFGGQRGTSLRSIELQVAGRIDDREMRCCEAVRGAAAGKSLARMQIIRPAAIARHS